MDKGEGKGRRGIRSRKRRDAFSFVSWNPTGLYTKEADSFDLDLCLL